MFALRGIAVSLALFWLSYCLLSALVAFASRYLDRLRDLPPRILANLLFGIRVFPLMAALATTLVFVAPSFLWLEPRGGDEEVGFVPVLLGVLCLAFFAVGVIRTIRAQSSTSRLISNWLRGARMVDVGTTAPSFQAPSGVPPLMLAGVCKPTLLLSESTLSLLTHDELQGAIRHEMAHIRFRDNLKKLALRFAWFPGMRGIEKSWQHAAELAADDAAVSNAREALDLAAALIKLSREVHNQPLPAISMALVQDGALSTRVSRLLNWSETGTSSRKRLRNLTFPAVVATVVAVAALYVPLLSQTHAITEWLVR